MGLGLGFCFKHSIPGTENLGSIVLQNLTNSRLSAKRTGIPATAKAKDSSRCRITCSFDLSKYFLISLVSFALLAFAKAEVTVSWQWLLSLL